MIQKLGIALGGLTASLILAIGLVAAGFAPTPAEPLDPPVDPPGSPGDTASAPEAVGFLSAELTEGLPLEAAVEDPEMTGLLIEPETVFIAPAATPEIILEQVARRRETGDDDEGMSEADADDDDDSRERDDSRDSRDSRERDSRERGQRERGD